MQLIRVKGDNNRTFDPPLGELDQLKPGITYIKENADRVTNAWQQPVKERLISINRLQTLINTYSRSFEVYDYGVVELQERQ